MPDFENTPLFFALIFTALNFNNAIPASNNHARIISKHRKFARDPANSKAPGIIVRRKKRSLQNSRRTAKNTVPNSCRKRQPAQNRDPPRPPCHRGHRLRARPLPKNAQSTADRRRHWHSTIFSPSLPTPARYRVPPLVSSRFLSLQNIHQGTCPKIPLMRS